MAVFPLLASPDLYRACEADLLLDAQAREYWISVYEAHSDVQLQAAADTGIAQDVRCAASDAWLKQLADIRENPQQFDRLDILTMDALRQAALLRFGIRDEFQQLKKRENESAMRVLPKRLQSLDAIEDHHARLAELCRGILAGNLFDMGVKATASKYAGGTLPFDEALQAVPARPWFIDHVDLAATHLQQSLPDKVVIFVDNAGADIVLGVLPLAREFISQGMHVVLTANRGPAHNDITHDELIGLVKQAASIDASFNSSRLELICSGNDAPLIDLMQVSEELAAASHDAQFVVLVGMGRSMESNYSARMICPCWKIAMLKDAWVAASVGGQLFDGVMQFELAQKSTSESC